MIKFTVVTGRGYNMSAITITKENFEQEVMGSAKPVLLDFWAPWCGPCRTVSPIVDAVADEFARSGGSKKVGKINIDEQPELAERFNIMSIPTLIVMKNGKIVDKVMGAQPKETILRMLEH